MMRYHAPGTKMRLLVLGASNELMHDGYVAALAARHGHDVENRSLGYSTSSAGIYQLLKAEAGAQDFALLSYNLNDQGAMAKGVLQENDVRGNWAWMLFECHLQAITPVMIALPMAYEGVLERTKMHELQMVIAAEAGVVNLDFAALFMRACAAGGRVERLMRDDVHISPAAAEIVAGTVDLVLQNLARASLQASHKPINRHRIRLIAASELTGEAHCKIRQSSVTSGLYAQLLPGEMMEVPLGKEEEIMALSLNGGAKGAIALFESAQSRVAKPLIFYEEARKQDWYTSLIVDFQHKPAGGKAGLRLSLLAEDSAVNDATLHAQPALPGYYGALELEAFMVRRRQTHTETKPCWRRAADMAAFDRVIDQQNLIARLAAL